MVPVLLRWQRSELCECQQQRESQQHRRSHHLAQRPALIPSTTRQSKSM
nr:MAG TPA: hypothetical protein [Caudoviricetes sp.]